MRTELIELGCETSLFLAHRQICNFTVYSTYCHGSCYKVHNVSLYTHCALSIPYHATTDTLYIIQGIYNKTTAKFTTQFRSVQQSAMYFE